MITLKCVSVVVASVICNKNVFGILGGNDINIEDAPYQVNYGDICGGVLIHAFWVLTVAHCGTGKDFVRLGSKYRLKGDPILIKKHYIHPLYQLMHEFDYDAQLLQLRQEIKSRSTTKPIYMSNGECGDFVRVAGWGYGMEKGEYANVLQQVKLDLVSINTCQAIDKPWFNNTLTSRMFCAGDDFKDTCQGDSGGAAVSYNLLIGIASFGYGCGRNIPGVYINVSSPNIKTWIRRHTWII